jgi:mannose-6-phosphate isomerase-like protein (cupin superfamily)
MNRFREFITEGKSGFDIDIEKETIANENFRKVLFTSEIMQLVVMSIKPNDDIGLETHDGSQFIRIEAGKGKAIIGSREFPIKDGSAFVIPKGSKHNVINTSNKEDLKLYAVYSPPEHDEYRIDKEKPKQED